MNALGCRIQARAPFEPTNLLPPSMVNTHTCTHLRGVARRLLVGPTAPQAAAPPARYPHGPERIQALEVHVRQRRLRHTAARAREPRVQPVASSAIPASSRRGSAGWAAPAKAHNTV
eukprot:1158505-Pelagomonas_calceolata.AAC.3